MQSLEAQPVLGGTHTPFTCCAATHASAGASALCISAGWPAMICRVHPVVTLRCTRPHSQRAAVLRAPQARDQETAAGIQQGANAVGLLPMPVQAHVSEDVVHAVRLQGCQLLVYCVFGAMQHKSSILRLSRRRTHAPSVIGPLCSEGLTCTIKFRSVQCRQSLNVAPMLLCAHCMRCLAVITTRRLPFIVQEIMPAAHLPVL